MADITFAMERDSSHKAAKKKLDVRNNTKYTNRNQLAIAAVLFLGGVVGGYCFGIVSNGARRGVSVLIV